MGQVCRIIVFLFSCNKLDMLHRHQAGDIPDVVRVDVDPLKLKKPQTNYVPCVAAIASCPDALLPSAHWEDDVLFTFSELRMVPFG